MNTKLGVHITYGPRNGYGLVAGSCRVVVADGEGGALLEAEQKSSNQTITIFKSSAVFGDAPQGIDQTDEAGARALGDQWYPALYDKWMQNPANYYQISNEYGGNSPAALRNLVAFETRILELSEGDGLKCVVASLAGGSPGDLNLWKQIIVPLIARAWSKGHLYGRHAYGPGMLTTVDATGNIIPTDQNSGRPFTEAAYLSQQGLRGGLVITEAGQNAGYEFPGVEAFIKDSIAYDKLMSGWPDIIGACLWTYGQFRPGVNIQDASEELAGYLQSAPFAPWTPPTPNPDPDPDPDPEPSPTTPDRIRIISDSNVRNMPKTAGNTPIKLVMAGLEMDKVAVVIGESVAGDNRWVRGRCYIAKGYSTDLGNGRLRITRSVNLRVVATTVGNSPIVTLQAGTELEFLGEYPEVYGANSRWLGVAIYTHFPRTKDVPAAGRIQLVNPLPIPLYVTSPFNAPRDYANKRHEGLDFRATDGQGRGLPVRAAAPGLVDGIRTTWSGTGYGRYIRLKHANNYYTWYCHLGFVGVAVGQEIAADQEIGVAGNSGTGAIHLHFNLVHQGQGLMGYVVDWVVDPTCYLHPSVAGSAPPPPGNTFVGLHASADPGDLHDSEFAEFVATKPDVVKILSAHAGSSIQRLANNHPNADFIIRAFLDVKDGVQRTPQQFYDQTINDVQRAVAAIGPGRQVWIELHNEPNLKDEGLWISWANGQEFNNWLILLLGLYRRALPTAKFIFPGLSPGGSVGGVRISHVEFIEQCRPAVLACDALGVHTYWSQVYPMSQALAVVDDYIGRFPGKAVWVTEASRNDRPAVLTPAQYGQEYIQFANHLGQRLWVLGVTYFVASASNEFFHPECWIVDDFRKGIGQVVGSR